MLLAHGLLKIFVFTLPGTVGFFGKLGLPAIAAYATIGVEVIGGLMLIAGILTRWVSLAAIPVLLGATFVHLGNGWLFSGAGGGWEFPAFWTVALAVQAMLGDGAYSAGASSGSAASRGSPPPSDLRPSTIRGAQARRGRLTSSILPRSPMSALPSSAMPTLFISHGAPTVAIDNSEARAFLEGLGRTLGRPRRSSSSRPTGRSRAVVLVTGAARPDTIHDFGPFDRRLYEMRYPAPGAPDLAADIAASINDAGLAPGLMSGAATTMAPGSR